MAQTYSQLQARIAKLQSKAETLRKAELAEVIAKIRVAISAYNITSADLFGGRSMTPPMTKSAAAPKPKSAGGSTAKFADDRGNEWVGRGPRPLWLREELAAGMSLSDFAVAANAPSEGRNYLSSKAPKKAAGKTKVRGTRKPVLAKYRDAAGNSWSGRGSQPNWLKKALASGEPLNRFVI